MASSKANVRVIAQAYDTFYVGNMKGVGRIYQQTFIDTYAKVSKLSPSSMTARRRSPRPISSTIASCQRSMMPA